MHKKIILVGTGQMAIDYTNVLQAQQLVFTVVGRGETSAHAFELKTGIKPVTGGIQQYVAANPLDENTYVIIATGTEALMPTLLAILTQPVGGVLIEKPAALSIEELIRHEHELEPSASKIFVAYNRRFYASVMEAERLIAEDGGLQSMSFEFTEWSHKIEPLQKAAGVKENWFFANSTHVVDLAFFLAGKPTQWQSFVKPGKLTWHPATNFTGAGITDKGTLFCYLSNWESAGRWAIELLTENRRIYLKPMEELSVQQKGTIAVTPHAYDDSFDKNFKPGLYKQVEAFMKQDGQRMIDINEHIHMAHTVYERILNG